jgi:Xaa-Pro aminopeptidase
MYEILRDHLNGTPYADRLVSAEPIVNALRGRKTPAELERIRRAIEITAEIYWKTFDFIRVGMTEIEIAEYMHQLGHSVGFAPAESCPAVNAGPNSPVGHSSPTKIQVERGHIIHFDFGVKYEDYCSDIQRIAYVLREDEREAPPEVQRGFMTIRTAIEKSREAMQPGVTGNSIDVIAQVLADAGYPEYQHALGTSAVAWHTMAAFAGSGRNMTRPIKGGTWPSSPLVGLTVPYYGISGSKILS